MSKQDITKLTPAQRDVINLFAAGMDTPSIAEYLGVGEQTIKNHIYGAKLRLEPNHWVSRGRLVALYVAEYGLPQYHPPIKEYERCLV